MNDFSFKIFLYLVVVFSAIIHEYFHGWMANYLGDSTAKDAGRLTLNPLKHLDPIGTVLLPLFLLFFGGTFIGWAKPVPYNPYNLRDRKYGSSKVALAGPLSNFFIAVIFGLTIRFLKLSDFIYLAFTLIVYINIFLALFNFIPIPPLDGSKLLMDFFPSSRILQRLETSFVGIFLAIILAMIFLPYIANFIFFIITGQVY
jgi:Zn-dependent protease